MPLKIGLKTRRKKMLEQELKRIIPILIKLGAEKIILFGSLAKGNVHKSSDFDLFIVMDTDKDFMERLDEVYKACNPRVAVDFFVYTPKEIEDGLVSPVLLKEIQKHGRVIYEKKRTNL